MIAQIPPEIAALFTQKALLWATAGWLLLQNLGRIYHAIASGGGLVSIWHGVIFGTNVPTQKEASADAARGALSVLLAAFVLSGLSAGLFMVSGCGTTPQQASYQAAGTIVTSADAAMTAWGDYVAQFHPPASQEAAVKAAYQKYQATMAALVDAVQIYVTLAGSGSTNAPPALTTVTTAQQLASQSLADLLAMLTQFGVKL
jgi:hypothetical protein